MAKHPTPRKSTYAEKLKDPRWQRKRLEILNRDDWTCMHCGSSDNTLHVHHLSYRQGADPWDYESDLLQTLCEGCHQAESEARPQAEARLLEAFRHLPVSALTLNVYSDALEYVSGQVERWEGDRLALCQGIELALCGFGLRLTNERAMGRMARLYAATLRRHRQEESAARDEGV